MAKQVTRYQIIRFNEAEGKWEFTAHGARYGKAEAEAYKANAEARGVAVRLISCGKS